MAYSSIPDEEIAGNKPVLSATAIKLRDNTDDHTHVGDVAALGVDSVGASQIAASAVGQPELAGNAVGQGEVKTAINPVSTTSIRAKLTLAGGEYGFYPQTKMSVTSTSNWLANIISNDLADGTINPQPGWASYETIIELGNNSGFTSYAQQRYFAASPPYDIGNGDIPLFMYAIVNSSGKIESISTAPDPTWAYNGRNAINPRKRYKKKGNPNYFHMKKQRPNKDNDFDAWLESYKNPKIIESVEEEITQAVKNQDMNEVPHPFIGNDLTGKTVVLIDPVGKMCDCLFDMHEEGEDAHDVIRNYLIINQDPIKGAKSPKGVMTVKARWK